jgi:hypothetical protein
MSYPVERMGIRSSGWVSGRADEYPVERMSIRSSGAPPIGDVSGRRILFSGFRRILYL